MASGQFRWAESSEARAQSEGKARLAAEKRYEQERIEGNAARDVRANRGLGDAAIGNMIDAAKDAQIQNTASADFGRAAVPKVQADAQTQRGYATTFAGMGADAQQQATPWLSAGADMLSLNPEASGMAGAWAKNYNALSPDSLVSFAASDAQKSIENTRGQMARTLSRSGVSPSSPAYIAALGEAKKYEQALLAGVKTRARLLGLKEQSGALEQGMKMALGAAGMGDQLTRQALSAVQAASGATGAATDAEVKAAGIQAQASSLENAGRSTLANAQQVAADYYSTQASSVLGLLQSGANTSLKALFS